MDSTSHDTDRLAIALYGALRPWTGCCVTPKIVAALAVLMIAEARRRGLRLDAGAAVDSVLLSGQRGGGFLTRDEMPLLGSRLAVLMADDVTLCLHCGERVATCSGRYEAMTEEAPACDECCGHGNEDGRCRPLEVTP